MLPAWTPACQRIADTTFASRESAAISRAGGGRPGAGGRLAASLTDTNCIESMTSIARDTTKNVKRWRDGKMIKRRRAAGMLNAERSSRRLKGQPPDAATRRCARRSRRSCHTGLRYGTSRMT